MNSTDDTGDLPMEKLDLFLTFENLAKLELHANIDASNGDDIFGEDPAMPRAFAREQLDNRTVRILNKIIVSVCDEPIDQTALDSLLRNGSPSRGAPNFDAQVSIANRFAYLHHELVEAQIYVPSGNDGIPLNPETVGYPLQLLLDNLQQHELKNDTDLRMRLRMRENKRGEIVLVNGSRPLWDYMTDVDDHINCSFWCILKLLSLFLAG